MSASVGMESAVTVSPFYGAVSERAPELLEVGTSISLWANTLCALDHS